MTEQNTIITTKNRPLTVLKLLWEKFQKQALFWQMLTLCCMLLFIVWAAIFFSAFFLWLAFKYLMVNVGLRVLEWYLRTDINEKSPPPSKTS